jgi:hypothetical protein
MKVNIEITPAEAALIRRFTSATSDGTNTHGKLDIPTLAQMLLEDVGLMIRRPGCWEAENMRSLLSSHGYEDATYVSNDGAV